VDEATAAYLMGKLLPVAGRKGIHEVYNAVQLWLQGSHSSEIATVLERLASESGPHLRRMFESWRSRPRDDL
jgi:hypothetical protein